MEGCSFQSRDPNAVTLIKELNEVDFELNVVFAIGSPKTKQAVIKKIDYDWDVAFTYLNHFTLFN
jgi:hypothetical protein